jgi:hypothetical protein
MCSVPGIVGDIHNTLQVQEVCQTLPESMEVYGQGKNNYKGEK